MFDIGATELLLIIVIAVIVIGPKDMPMALRTAGRWIGKMRRVSGHFRAGLDAMVREAEMEDMQKEWDKRNADIMAKHPTADPETGKLAHDDAQKLQTDEAGARSAGAELDGKSEAPAAPAKMASPPPSTDPAKRPADPEPLPLFADNGEEMTAMGRTAADAPPADKAKD